MKNIGIENTIIKELTKKISAGTLAPSHKLPSLSRLASNYNTSRTTVHRALKKMASSGYIRFIPGRGVFVQDAIEQRRQRLRDNCIVVIFSNMRGSLASEIERGIESVITQGNYFLTVFNSRDNFEREREILEESLVLNPKGIIIFPVTNAYQPNPNNDIYLEVQRTGVPFIFIDNYPLHLDVDYVCPNNFQGSYDLTSYLISLGHTRIAYFGRLDHVSSLAHRYGGYKKAMVDAGLDVDWRLSFVNENTSLNPNLTFVPQLFMTVGGEYLERLMESNNRPTAIIIDDMASRTTVKILSKFKIPDEISICCRRYIVHPEDINVHFNAMYNRKLTDVLDLTYAEYYLPDIGEKAAEVIFDKLQGKSSDKRVKIDLPMPIHIGNSAKKIMQPSSAKEKAKVRT